MIVCRHSSGFQCSFLLSTWCVAAFFASICSRGFLELCREFIRLNRVDFIVAKRERDSDPFASHCLLCVFYWNFPCEFHDLKFENVSICFKKREAFLLDWHLAIFVTKTGTKNWQKLRQTDTVEHRRLRFKGTVADLKEKLERNG